MLLCVSYINTWLYIIDDIGLLSPCKLETRIVGFRQSVNGRKDQNPTGKSCSEYFKASGGKNEKARREALHEKRQLDLYFAYRKHWMEIKITEYVICKQEAFYIIEILLYIYILHQTEVISGFSFTLVSGKLPPRKIASRSGSGISVRIRAGAQFSSGTISLEPFTFITHKLWEHLVGVLTVS